MHRGIGGMIFFLVRTQSNNGVFLRGILRACKNTPIKQDRSLMTPVSSKDRIDLEICFYAPLRYSV